MRKNPELRGQVIGAQEIAGAFADRAQLVAYVEQHIAAKFLPGEIPVGITHVQAKIPRVYDTGVREVTIAQYPPTEHFKDGLIDGRVIADLKAGGQMLSVGAGSGNLEKVLSRIFDIPPEQITLADRDLELCTLSQTAGFPRAEFNMRETWPEFPQKFKQIVFPVSYNNAYEDGSEEWGMRSNLVYSDIVPDNTPINKMAASEEFWVFMEQTYKKICANRVRVIIEALKNLEAGGQVRINGLESTESGPFIAAYLLAWGRRQHPELSFELVERAQTKALFSTLIIERRAA